MVGGDPIGALNVYSEEKSAFDEEEIKKLEACSYTIALAIERSKDNPADWALVTKKSKARLSPQRLLDQGFIYVSRGDLEEVLRLFKSHLDNGYRGLCITRKATHEIQKERDWLKRVPVFQLSREAFSLSAIWGYSGLTILVSSFMRVSERPFVLIDGLEELERSPERGQLPSFVEEIHRCVSEVSATMVIRMEIIEDSWLDLLQGSCRFL